MSHTDARHADARYRQLLDDRRALLRIRYCNNPRALDEIETVRLRAIEFELDILDYDSPHGQWLYEQERKLDAVDVVLAKNKTESDPLMQAKNLSDAAAILGTVLRG